PLSAVTLTWEVVQGKAPRTLCATGKGAAAIAHRSRLNSRAEDRRSDQHRYADRQRDEGQRQGIDHDRLPCYFAGSPGALLGGDCKCAAWADVRAVTKRSIVIVRDAPGRNAEEAFLSRTSGGAVQSCSPPQFRLTQWSDAERPMRLAFWPQSCS